MNSSLDPSSHRNTEDGDSDEDLPTTKLDKGKQRAEAEPSHPSGDAFSSTELPDIVADSQSTRSRLSSSMDVNQQFNNAEIDDDESYHSAFGEDPGSHRRDNADLAHSIEGMYRILDLISEQGSGGLVDKIIISQNSLEAFIHSVRPGAYTSMIKVDFKALDEHAIKPVGIYGSKDEIVRFLLQLGVVDDDMATQLLVDAETHGRTKPTLRSGLYIVKLPTQHDASQQIFLVYWPEHTTWDDSSASSISRNRVTFMRYLTKMCDQVIALISPEHAQTIVWNETDETGGDSDADYDEDESDRICTFEVSQTNEQEESVTVRDGFKAVSEHIRVPGRPSEEATKPDWPPEPVRPFLLFGETAQGFITVRYREACRPIENLKTRPLSALQLETYLTSDCLHLDESLAEDAMKILARCGLEKRFPQECNRWKRESATIQNVSYSRMNNQISNTTAKLRGDSALFRRALHEMVVEELRKLYPGFDHDMFVYYGAHERSAESPETLAKLLDQYPDAFNQVAQLLQPEIKSAETISDKQYRAAKRRLCLFKELDRLLKQHQPSDQDRAYILDLVVSGGVDQVIEAMDRTLNPNAQASKWNIVAKFLPGGSGTRAEIDKLVRDVLSTANQIPDKKFLAEIDSDIQQHPELKELAGRVKQLAFKHLNGITTMALTRLVNAMLQRLVEENEKRIRREYGSLREKEQRQLRVNLIARLNGLSENNGSRHTVHIDAVAPEMQNWAHTSTSYRVSGKRETQVDAAAIYTVHLMNLTAEDQHKLQLDPSATIPSPRFKFKHTFKLPLGYSVIRAQLLENEKLLLIVADRAGNLTVYLEHFAGIDGAIERGRGKSLNRERIGKDFLLTYDQAKHMLSVVSSDKLLIHIFVLDETRGFQALGSAVNLSFCYPDGASIRHACFISGSEELLLVDSRAQARVYSLVTLQFRPATVDLKRVPHSISSTPDGACLLVAHEQDGKLTFMAYHWSTFGSTEGIALDIPNLVPEDTPVVTSLVSRTAIHLMSLDFSSYTCRSYALDITRKVTEFTFKETGARGRSSRKESSTAHNCLIDCHSDVWTRFPVLAAVQRETISTSSLRSQKMLVFVTDRDFTKYAPYFADKISEFERGTKKPTGDVLKSIKVSAAPFDVFSDELCGSQPWNVSELRVGEWIVNFLCLIPIHLAVAKENRFVPLKDGVYSPDHEKSLLGADVNRIVDTLSFGWYESIFQSYMASKPVRVVSSMGEQSVGKSFALNHLVDTSFAGSAMRTTEGVWMSVTPTKEALIVALDFEGVHSIERSAQEDTLLVLFNTAISNLVLFRNNFAMSRDITGLFQSFQSSSTILDPEANPSLFRSTLAIIIKDVVDSDKAEIVREFSLKFQRIVQDEQEANFITQLHAGKLHIIPWPVIESKEFYKLFTPLKRRLGEQDITHEAAGEFLHMMKTLMAKLKANDWGAMSQTMASHRAQLISTLLPNALAFGVTEIEPELEPLKNLDTDVPVDLPDTEHQLFIAGDGAEQSALRENILMLLQKDWDRFESRQRVPEDEWIEGLSEHLDNIVDLRIAHVEEWLTQNLSRFQSGHASIDELNRNFENAILDLKSNVQLCSLQCAGCQLLCVQSRLHDGAHDCRTDHRCVHDCDFCLEGSVEHKRCTVPAGHAGKHICVPTQHMCAKPCQFSGKHGCLDVCAKITDHPDQDDHLCAAPVHACGEPCGLAKVKLADGPKYSCPGKCRIPSGVDHARHQCEARFCSIKCQLCRRLCSEQDHMHGLGSGAVHLCGQEHMCPEECTAKGICQIDTAPHSIEVTFTGRNETFQYTKYTQVAKRMRCIKPIPAGATTHTGSHEHSLDNVVHFCETRCKNCDYFCTLPLGHPQQEHETRHGSMSHTRWAIDGPDDVPLEIGGRKFSSNDEGAPMMCSLVCQALGRHVHIDYCRATGEDACTGSEELQHLTQRLQPNPDRPKDVLTHNLFWKRSGFRDPYSKEDQAIFTRCDSMCSGPEHTAESGNPAVPSYCVLPLFHAPLDPNVAAPVMGYISQDGHQFACRNPVVMQQAFHIIFVVDYSGSMGIDDRKPLAGTPVTARIAGAANNRYGAVLSSLYGFWATRATALAGSKAVRRDAYSVVLFDHNVESLLVNDFVSTPDQLLEILLRYRPDDGGTNFTLAISRAQEIVAQSWSTERSPVIIFLSDGDAAINDQVMQDLCRSSIRLGKALSFHAVSFGPEGSSRFLVRMTDIARDAQNKLDPAIATIASSYTQALDTVQLAETFLGIAESLRKPRGALLH